ncbi:uncharacterized protein LOC5508158 [Nematostella vectensis]|uniref:uncharacterized protein LOC5508158 n=1 Tax=Nematostella vectensis TaxID=45351 RepID=UPI0020773D34|nr:uncharacterized protein LOC5508158 [Nematostella vectensis]
MPCLNGGTCQASYHDDNYSCTCRPEYPGRNCDEAGLRPETPARSCKQIRDDVRPPLQINSGQFWLDPAGIQESLPSFCDMATDGGGWTLVMRYLITIIPPVFVYSSSYQTIKDYNRGDVLPNVYAYAQLRTHIGFVQLRFRCYKQSVGRTIDIMTTNDSAGAAVLHHFLDSSSPPPACGSFVRLPDDNSNLTRSCMKWGLAGSQTMVNQWSRSDYLGPSRIFADPIVWFGARSFNAHLNGPKYPRCDDYVDSVSIGDYWEIYFR